MADREALRLPGLGSLLLTGVRPLIAIGLAFLVGAVMILAAGANPLEAYAALLSGALVGVASISNTAVRMAPLLLGGLGIGLGFKAGVLNVGIEGQIYAGGAAAAAIGLIPLPVPAWIHVTLAVLAGFLGGALWGFIPAYLRAYRNVNEIVTTLMMNYVGIYFVSFLVHTGPMAEKDAFYPMSPPLMPSSHLPILIKGTSLHTGIVMALVLAIVAHFVLQYTPFGFRTRMVGANPDAARYAGLNVGRQIFLVMLVSAGFGGLAGAGEVLGLKLRLFDFFASGVGYDSIAVALMAAGNPLGIILSAVFFGGLKAGANRMQIVVGIETHMASVIQALAVLFVIAIGFTGQARARRKKEKQEPTIQRGGAYD